MNEDPKAAKILSDLLALTLAENEPQGEAAIGAIRRRATIDGVTGGAIKALVQRLLAAVPPERPAGGTALQIGEGGPDVAQMRFTLDEQQRELHDTHHAQHLTEGALAELRATNEALASRIGTLNRTGRSGRIVSFVVGALCAAVVAGLIVVVPRLRLPVILPAHQAGLSVEAQRKLGDAIRSCFIASSNSLGGGSSTSLHLLLDTDAQGRIVGESLAPDEAEITDPSHRLYSQLMLRTLGGGSCGPLPLPASLRGRPAHLDLVLPG